MATNREVEELIARCVGIMVFYRNSGKTTQSRDLMAAEVRAVARDFQKWQPEDGVVKHVLDSVKDEMIARYGHELGVRLDGEFYKAFEGEAVPIPTLSPSMSRR